VSGISRERAERIARAHACGRCGEYSYKKVSVKAVEPADDHEEAWHAAMVCGVCGLHQELALDREGEILYVE
jgi:transcription elongation factor Elf1